MFTSRGMTRSLGGLVVVLVSLALARPASGQG